MSLYKGTPLKPLISIPVPCHEDWNKMTPTEKGSYCAVCKKVVWDFSVQTDEEINNYLLERRGKKVCGRFRVDQVVPNVKLGFSFELIPNFLSPLKKFALAALFIFGSSLFTITSVKGENVIAFNIELSLNSISTNYFSVPKVFNKTEMDSIMSSYDSLSALLVPIPYNDTDQTEIADLPPLPGTSAVDLKDTLEDSLNINWIIVQSLPPMGVMCSPIDHGVIQIFGGGTINWDPEPGPGPKFDPTLKIGAETPVPIHSVQTSSTSEEKQKENEEDDRKRDIPKDKRNDDLIDDSDFPSLRKEK